MPHAAAVVVGVDCLAMRRQSEHRNHRIREEGSKVAAKAVKNWNQKLFSYYSSGYSLVPVQLYISAGRPQTLWVHPVPDLGADPRHPELHIRATTGNWQYDPNSRLLGAETKITSLMTYDVTLTNAFAHELGAHIWIERL